MTYHSEMIKEPTQKSLMTKKQENRKKRQPADESSDEEWGVKRSRVSKKRQEMFGGVHQKSLDSEKTRHRRDANEEWEADENEQKLLPVLDENLSKLDDEEGPNATLFYDEEDQKNLMNLPEIEREKILFQRAEERQALLERQELARRLKIVEVERSKSLQKKSPRLRTKETGRLSSLRELRARRERTKSGTLERSRGLRDEQDEPDINELSDEYASDSYHEATDDSEEDLEDYENESVEKSIGFKSAKHIKKREYQSSTEDRGEAVGDHIVCLIHIMLISLIGSHYVG